MHFLLLNICTMRDKQIRKSMSIKKQHGLHSVWNYSRPVILLKVSLGANVQFEMFYVTPCFFDSFLNPSDMPFSTSKIHFKIGLLNIWGHVYFSRRVSLKFYEIQKTTCWRINISKSQHTERPWKQTVRSCANPPKEGTVLCSRGVFAPSSEAFW